MRTIRVTGKGRLKLKPDLTRINIDLKGLYGDYSETLRRSSEDTEELKTLAFNVDTEYESYQEEGAWKQRFKGYRYYHSMKLEFDMDNERLGRILYSLAKSPLDPDFRLSYSVRDPEAAKNELLGRAVADAGAKAKVLSSAAGVALKEIQSIDYSWGEVSFETRPMNKMIMADAAVEESAAFGVNIQPDDIEVSDTVTVVWEIG